MRYQSLAAAAAQIEENEEEIPEAPPTKDEDLKSFNIDRVCIELMQHSAFYATISRYVQKVATRKIPTAAVTYDKNFDCMTLMYNPDFFNKVAARPDGKAEVQGVVKHEFDHLVWDHVGHRRRQPHNFWNIATDAAINSYEKSIGTKFPPGLIDPGEIPTDLDGNPAADVKEGSLQWVIKNWPKCKASEWYFEDLKSKAEEYDWPKEIKIRIKGGGANGEDVDIDGDSFDDHGGWDDIPEEEREFIRERVKQIVERAVQEADSRSNGWGNMPADMRESIRKFVSRQVDWRQALRQFIGRTIRASKSKSIKKINKKYPYIHPGVKRGYVANMIIAIDMSGSVCDEWLKLFFGELSSLSRLVTFTVLPFDHTVAESDMFVWRKGTTPALSRVRCGGTDFDAPTDFVNDPRRRGVYDGLIICTDGCAPKPKSSRVKRAWVISPSCKINFQTDETVIQMTNDKAKVEGPWR